MLNIFYTSQFKKDYKKAKKQGKDLNKLKEVKRSIVFFAERLFFARKLSRS